MTVRELREKYLAFFESKGHQRFPSAPLVPIDVTGRLDESLLFTGAGMVQFKPFFRGIAKPDHPRLITVQKCVRTGDIEAVGDPNHLTFFEMLGNFSFGDYFKAQAISFSWEFLTSPEWLGLDKNRLAFTVFEEDDESFVEWERWLIASEVDPSTRIFRLDEETNYWPAGSFSKGPPGPCGPNSEMFFWLSNDEPPPSANYTRDDFVRDEAAGKWLEIWNDVFIQFEWQGHLKNSERQSEGWAKDAMPPLPFNSVDTGMGLDRTAATINGLKSVYQTDAFLPIFQKLAEISVQSSSPAGSVGERANTEAAPTHVLLQAMAQGLIPDNEPIVRAGRIIADHIRTAVFCIADGVLPSNTGRGYVLRRLIRRAVLKGQRVLGFQELFLYRVYEAVAETMGHHYTELRERRDVIIETLRNEEALFRRTLNAGTAMLQGEMERLRGKAIPGDLAFRLYDTFGFPLEVTQELAEEAGLTVDLEGFELELKEAQDRSRAVGAGGSVYAGVAIMFDFGGGPTPTDFAGYTETETDATIVGALPMPKEPGTEDGPTMVIALDVTPFYAASGGQVSDTGVIKGEGFELKVIDVGKEQGVYVHYVEVGPNDPAPADLFGKRVRAVVDKKRRAEIRRNHTATHLLHAALRDVLGAHVTQAGSYVGPDRLRFDFTHGKGMSPDELSRVEHIVNEKVLDNRPVVTYVDIPVADAKAMGAMALFGEKYGDRVRVVQVGDEPPEDCTSFSRELCGGTHVRSTGEIGLFKILSEGSAASGVRRIEAITGEGAYQWVVDLNKRVAETAAALKSNPHELTRAVKALQDTVSEERKRREKAEQALVRGEGGGGSGGASEQKEVGPVKLWTPKYDDVDQKIVASAVDDAINGQPTLVAVAALRTNGKVTFICKVGSEAQAKGAHAGNLVSAVAKVAGGGGGGRPDFATAGGKQPEKVDEALAAAEGVLKQMVGGQ
ncbi:MAG: alanyl-tRNA synthetase [Fimbriimonadaceae bacterium]|nr:alanyl-tRNA synthetase [Fimbriimonadaceae bacterium]